MRLEQLATILFPLALAGCPRQQAPPPTPPVASQSKPATQDGVDAETLVEDTMRRYGINVDLSKVNTGAGAGGETANDVLDKTEA